jgi:hypothetical protein
MMRGYVVRRRVRCDDDGTAADGDDDAEDRTGLDKMLSIPAWPGYVAGLALQDHCKLSPIASDTLC